MDRVISTGSMGSIMIITLVLYWQDKWVLNTTEDATFPISADTILILPLIYRCLLKVA